MSKYYYPELYEFYLFGKTPNEVMVLIKDRMEQLMKYFQNFK